MVGMFTCITGLYKIYPKNIYYKGHMCICYMLSAIIRKSNRCSTLNKGWFLVKMRAREGTLHNCKYTKCQERGTQGNIDFLVMISKRASARAWANLEEKAYNIQILYICK